MSESKSEISIEVQKANFIKSRQDIQSNASLMESIRNFEDNISSDHSDLVGMVLPPFPHEGTIELPLFTHIVEKGKHVPGLPAFIKPVILFETEEFIFLLNDKMPDPKAYPEGKEGLAGMALIHFFGIPKNRIYNAVSLSHEKGHIELIERMQLTANDYLSKIENRVTVSNLVKGIIAKTRADLVEKFEADIAPFLADSGKLEFYFHVHPKHSVGHLHMHCLAGARTSHEHDYKNTSSEVVLEVLREEAAKKPE